MTISKMIAAIARRIALASRGSGEAERALVAAYSVLCLIINMGTNSGRNTPYWVLLAASVTILYMAWFHPIRIAFA